MSSAQAKLEVFRQTIDQLDQEILSLLERRAEAALEVGDMKKELGLQVTHPEREQEVLRKIQQAEHLMSPDSRERLFRLVIEECRGLQEARLRHSEPKPKKHQATTLGPSRMAIVGLGLIGGSLLKALAGLKDSLGLEDPLGLKELVLCDLDPHSPPNAELERLSKGGLDLRKVNLDEALSYPLVALAVPIEGLVEILSNKGKVLKKGSLLFDMCSTKAIICKLAEDHLPEGVHFVGGHPLAGREEGGWKSSSGDLFQNKTFLLTPTARSRPDDIQLVNRLMTAVGSQVELIPPAEHDQALARSSHLPHLVAVALALGVESSLQQSSLQSGLKTPSLKEMTRIAKAPFSLWQSILLSNRAEVLKAGEEFIHRLGEMLKDLAGAQPSAQPWASLEGYFYRARRARAQLEKLYHLETSHQFKKDNSEQQSKGGKGHDHRHEKGLRRKSVA